MIQSPEPTSALLSYFIAETISSASSDEYVKSSDQKVINFGGKKFKAFGHFWHNFTDKN